MRESKTMPTVLFLSANPRGSGTLALAREFREIQEVIRRTGSEGRVRLVAEWAVRPSDLQEQLLRHEPALVHISGHGLLVRASPDGSREDGWALLLEDHAGEAKTVPLDAVADLFGQLNAGVRCIVMNACRSAEQPGVLTRYVDHVVGMSDELDDDAAVEFARGFYTSLMFGKSFAESVELGRNAVMISSERDELRPRLFTRPGVDPNSSVLLSRDEAGTTRRIAPHWRRMAVGATLMVVLATAALGLRSSLPFFFWDDVVLSEGEIALLAYSGAQQPTLVMFEELCARLQELDRQSTSCRTDVARGALDALHEGRAGSPAASVLAFSDEMMLWVYPTGANSGHPLWGSIPPIRINSSEVVDAIAPLAVGLHSISIGLPTEVLPIPPDVVGWRWSTLSVALSSIAGGDAVSVDLLRRLQLECGSTGDPLCALAHYLVAASDPDCESASSRRVFEDLEVVDNLAIRRAVRLGLVRCEVRDSPRRAAARLLSILGDLALADRCTRLSVAPTVVAVLKELDSDAPERVPLEGTLDRMLSFRVTSSACPSWLEAKAMSVRGIYHGERGRWQEAANDFLASYTTYPWDKTRLLNWAEASIKISGVGKATNVAHKLGEEISDVNTVPQKVLTSAAFLRWVATQERSLGVLFLAALDRVPPGEMAVVTDVASSSRLELCPHQDELCILDLVHGPSSQEITQQIKRLVLG